ncbi:hypothetical protein ITI46_12335 [Streptomyces oryzae]|uniref:Uncharacterized protein n=1 Tax=Streptomyces oryzae TaxID=1434886 RepID=A0ABS3XAR0_9ACTN|nr:hypothetical protein [Streptomyces oryzae]MBO8192448.1 hypothetical protein [Streptomyces oryzae]
MKLPDHPAYQQIMAVFAAADAPLRARAVCEAMDLEIAPNNVNRGISMPLDNTSPTAHSSPASTPPRTW